jgi:hypothetical protein
VTCFAGGRRNNQTTAQPEAAPERKIMAPGIKKPNAKTQSSPT